jgi:hypothetical protein
LHDECCISPGGECLAKSQGSQNFNASNVRKITVCLATSTEFMHDIIEIIKEVNT